MTDWKKHIGGLIIIFIIQYFITDIVAWAYLKKIHNSIKVIAASQAKIYMDGNYRPLFQKYPTVNKGWGDELNEIKDYKYAIISFKNNHTEEIYYTRIGSKEKLIYNSNKLISHNTEEDYPRKSILFLPGITLILFMIGAITYRLRIGSFNMIDALRFELKPLEKIISLYGLGTIFITCTIMFIKDF